jgi:ABC-type sulfate transport system permease component
LDAFSLVLAILAGLVLILPLLALFTKVPWATLATRLTESNALKAMWLSVWSSLLATLFCVILGIPLAWVLARGNKRIVSIIRPFVLAPIVLPPTVAGSPRTPWTHWSPYIQCDGLVNAVHRVGGGIYGSICGYAVSCFGR